MENDATATMSTPAPDALPTRRSLREARDGGSCRAPSAPQPPARSAAPTTATTAVRKPTAKAAPTGRRRRTVGKAIASVGVLSFAGAIVATLALPSYAFNGQTDQGAGSASFTHTAAGHQQLKVSGDVNVASVSRDAFSATSSAELLRQAYAVQYASYTGPSASDYIKNPAHPSFSLGAVIGVAQKYLGVPYVFGGANPSGFDCSGFVMFVYAQFGIALPHSVHQQDEIGAHISPADAQPGDIVVFNDDSHDGFYLGGGMILHAPYPGASVRIEPLWSNDVHFIRFGISH